MFLPALIKHVLSNIYFIIKNQTLLFIYIYYFKPQRQLILWFCDAAAWMRWSKGAAGALHGAETMVLGDFEHAHKS